MTAQDLVDDVVERLQSAEGTAKIPNRREVVARMAVVREQWGGLSARLVHRASAMFTTDQEGMLDAHKPFRLKLLVRARYVADLVFPADGSRPALWARMPQVKKLPALDDARWSKRVPDARRINALIEACAALPAGSR